MGKARAMKKVAGPSGSAKLAAKMLSEATTVQEITEAYCLALFLPCWMYPSFKKLVTAEFDKYPPTDKPVLLPRARVVAPPAPPPPAPPRPAPTGPMVGWCFGQSPLTRGIPISEPIGKEFTPDDFTKSFYPPGTRFFEMMINDVPKGTLYCGKG